MYSRHALMSADKLTPDFIAEKWQSTDSQVICFCGFCYRYIDTSIFKLNFSPWLNPCFTQYMAIIGASSPPKSRQEMDALAALPKVDSVVVPGSLGLHEGPPNGGFLGLYCHF